MMNLLFGTWVRRLITLFVLLTAFAASLVGALAVAVSRSPAAAAAVEKIPIAGDLAVALAERHTAQPIQGHEPPEKEEKSFRQLRPLSAEEITELIGDLKDQRLQYVEKTALLERERHRLELYRGELSKERELLEKLRDEIAAQWEGCKKARASLQRQVIDLNAVEAKNLKQLASAYEAMKPDRAAVIVQNLDENIAAKTLYLMRKRSVAKIMENLDPESATKLIERMTLLRQTN